MADEKVRAFQAHASAAEGTTRGERLESWKAIAAFFERDVRTVQRWENRDGLPVHRLPHGARDAVYAFTAELDAWRNRTWRDPVAPVPPAVAETSATDAPVDTLPPASGPRRPMVALASAGVLAILVASILSLRPLLVHGHARGIGSPPPLPFGARFFAASTQEGGHAFGVNTGIDLAQIVVSPSERTVYAAGSGELAIIDADRLRVLRRIPLAGDVRILRVSPDGTRLYVTFQDRTTLAVVDTSTDAVRQIELGSVPSDMTFTRDGGQLYVALPYAGLARIDTHTLIATRIALPPCPAALAMAPDARRLYVSFQCGGPGGRSGHDVIALFDPVSASLSPFLSQPPFVGGDLALTPDRAQLWVGSDGACTRPQYDHAGCSTAPGDPVYVIDAVRGSLLGVFAGDVWLRAGVRFSPAGDRAVTADAAVVDVSRATVLEHMPSDSLAREAAWSTDGRALYVGHGAELTKFAASAAACSPPLHDLVGWWPGDGTYADAYGIDNGAAQSSVDFVAGRAGQAFRFEAGQIDLGNSSSLDVFANRHNRYTLTAWMKIDGGSTAPQPLMSRTDARGGWLFERDPQAHLRFCVAGRCVSGGTPLAPETWYHVSAELSAGQVALFVNGHADGDGTLDTSAGEAADAHTYIGADLVHARHFQGLLDEVMVYGATLNANDLRQLTRLPECLRSSSRAFDADMADVRRSERHQSH